MGMKWRIGLVVVVAAAVLGGLVPHAVSSGADSSTAAMVQAVESPLATAAACTDATCNKGTSTPAAPTPVLVLAGVMGTLVMGALAAAMVRRFGRRTQALPAGTHDPLFHPPKFS